MADFTVYYRPLTLAYPKTIKTKKFIENIVRRSFGIRYNNDENVVTSYIRYSNSVMQKWHFKPLTTKLSSEMLFGLERSEDELFLKIIRIGNIICALIWLFRIRSAKCMTDLCGPYFSLRGNTIWMKQKILFC